MLNLPHISSAWAYLHMTGLMWQIRNQTECREWYYSCICSQQRLCMSFWIFFPGCSLKKMYIVIFRYASQGFFLYRHGSTFFRGPYKLNLVILSYLTLTWRCAIKDKTQSDTFYNSCHVIFHLYFGYLCNPSKLFLSLSFQCLTLITCIQ